MASPQNIGHIEVGRILPKPLELNKLLEIYGATERIDFFQEMRLRAKNGRDWWVNDHPPRRGSFSLFLGLESSAVQIESWDAHVPPGLFQTRSYADALLRVGAKNPAERIGRVDLRMSRQREVLEREHPPLVWSVIAEPALRWLVGGPEVLREQLNHLAELAEQPRIEIQVLPLSVGAHVGTGGTFTILSAPPELENYSGCVYVENRAEGLYYEESEQLLAYRNTLTRLRIQATKPEETAEYLRHLAKEL